MDSNQDLENNKQSTDGLSAGVDNEVKTVDKLEQENAMMNTVPKKKGSTMVLGMVLMAIAMICGIGFGVWTMIDAEAQKKELNSQISSLKQENAKLQEETDDVVVVEDISDYHNPIIRSLSSDEEYRVWLESSIVDEKSLRIGLKDGKVDICSIYNRSGAFVEDCNIEGIDGDIFDVIEFGEGQDNLHSKIGFIMTDGTVQYFPLIESMSNDSFVIKGEIKIDGFITDAIEITAGPTESSTHGGGYGSTVFVMSDGSYVKFDESMLNQ